MSSDDFFFDFFTASHILSFATYTPSISSVLCGIQYKRRLILGAQTVSRVPSGRPQVGQMLAADARRRSFFAVLAFRRTASATDAGNTQLPHHHRAVKTLPTRRKHT